jgi:AcrR family transcriptional regulator
VVRSSRRPRPEDRLEDVLVAGAVVFARRGYRRTQMAEVARERGVSPGNLYNYVNSKDALFYLVLRRVLGERPGERPLELPVTGANVAITAQWVAKRLDFVSDFPELERAFSRRLARASRRPRSRRSPASYMTCCRGCAWRST